MGIRSMWNCPAPFSIQLFSIQYQFIQRPRPARMRFLFFLVLVGRTYIHSSRFRHVPDSHGFSRLGRAGRSRYYRYFSQTLEVELVVYPPPFRSLYLPRILYPFFLLLSDVI